MTFKVDWEKTDQKVWVAPKTIRAMVAQFFPKESLERHEIISGGCSNLNIKIFLENNPKPFVLRIYLRDQTAAYREQKLAELLKKAIPIPTIYFIGQYDNYCFAISEFIPGRTLRDLLLGTEPYDLENIMYEVGATLAKLQKFQFSQAGFFDENLNVIHHVSSQNELAFAYDCLQQPKILAQIAPSDIMKIKQCLSKGEFLFPDNTQKNLVHADFDPANIMVDNFNHDWKITGILDWEFAFSGSTLLDVANMLRYSHQMPTTFEQSFLHGLKEGNVYLPSNWHNSIYLLNITALLDCLMRCDPKLSPNRCKDIRELITYFCNVIKI